MIRTVGFMLLQCSKQAIGLGVRCMTVCVCACFESRNQHFARLAQPLAVVSMTEPHAALLLAREEDFALGFSPLSAEARSFLYG